MQNPSPRRSNVAVRPAMLEQLERREMMAAQVMEDRIRVRHVSAGDVMINQSVLRIPTTEKVDIADASKIQVRGYAIDTMNPSLQKKIIINVLEAKIIEHDVDSSGLIELTLDRMMRMGGSIFFYEGALTNRSDGSAVPEDLTVRSPKGLPKDRFTLACRAFTPTDANLFHPFIYTGASDPTIASSDPADATVATDLSAFLDKKVAAGTITAAQRTNALALYNNPDHRIRIPNHNLRAAIASLTGTLAEGAVDVFLGEANATGRPYTWIDFGETTAAAVIADTTVTSQNRLEVRIKEGFNGEHFAALSAILAHESIHQDATFTVEEEVIGNLIQDIVYAQQLDADPSIASEGTQLVKLLNTSQVALINSGRTLFPVVGLLQAPLLHTTRGVFPHGKIVPDGQYKSYGNFVSRQYLSRGGVNGTSPGNATLDQYVAKFDGGAPAGAFSDQLITRLDSALHPVLTNALVIRTASALRLWVS